MGRRLRTAHTVSITDEEANFSACTETMAPPSPQTGLGSGLCIFGTVIAGIGLKLILGFVSKWRLRHFEARECHQLMQGDAYD